MTVHQTHSGKIHKNVLQYLVTRNRRYLKVTITETELTVTGGKKRCFFKLKMKNLFYYLFFAFLVRRVSNKSSADNKEGTQEGHGALVGITREVGDDCTFQTVPGPW